MALRLALVLLVLTVALVAPSYAGDVTGSQWVGLARFARGPTCDGLVGECFDDVEETLLDTESSQRARLLYQRRRFISYGALSRDRVPCNRRGQSYYNCRSRGRVNPYRRGCSAITRYDGEDKKQRVGEIETDRLRD
ncbi:Rapid alkalinization factor [Acorus calamus]|uniref:Rapid alkalinization factor n=1 Tax=Acorus calamus TaxID=4465 RepID=A0AAV9C7J3_ACOCL|nr:Rapid alkalinization factor [Acorus calamus]